MPFTRCEEINKMAQVRLSCPVFCKQWFCTVVQQQRLHIALHMCFRRYLLGHTLLLFLSICKFHLEKCQEVYAFMWCVCCCQVSQERIGVSAVPMAPSIFFQLPVHALTTSGSANIVHSETGRPVPLWTGSPIHQGIFLTQELNPDVLHCGQILYCLSYQENLLFMFPCGGKKR